MNPIEGAKISLIDWSANEVEVHYTNHDGVAIVMLSCSINKFVIYAEGYNAFYDEITYEEPFIHIVMTPVSAETELLSSIKVYPNPFTNSIELANAADVKRVTITNLLGQQIKDVVYSKSEKITIPTSDLAKGIYLITIEAINGQRVVRKMVKE